MCDLALSDTARGRDMTKRLEEEAFHHALKLFKKNNPHEPLTTSDEDAIYKVMVELIASGMTDRDLLASFAINRALRRTRGPKRQAYS